MSEITAKEMLVRADDGVLVRLKASVGLDEITVSDVPLAALLCVDVFTLRRQVRKHANTLMLCEMGLRSDVSRNGRKYSHAYYLTKTQAVYIAGKFSGPPAIATIEALEELFDF